MIGAYRQVCACLVTVLLAAACAAESPPTPIASPTSTPLTSGQPTPTATDSPAPPPTASPPAPTPSATAGSGLRVTRTVPYASDDDCGTRLTECQQFVDIYAPDTGGPWPVVVMLHGRPRTPADMVELAKQVARSGAVVFNADYRGVRPVVQEGWPEAIEDAACAVRFARATAPTYGGDGSRLVLVGHSFGGYVGTLVALAGDEFDGDCLAPDESALPDAWVGISANCLVGVPPPPAPLWTTFYGGDADDRPQAWAKGDPLEHVGGNPGLVVRFIHERNDPIVDVVQPRTLVGELKSAGYDATLTVLPGDEHWGPLDLDRDAGDVTLEVITQLLGG